MEHDTRHTTPRDAGNTPARRKQSPLSVVEYALLVGLLAVVIMAAFCLVGERLGLIQAEASTTAQGR